VKVLEIDPKSGKIRLSLREAEREMAAAGQN
jgi:predicted RNA-binding protein with RPS1 domain